MSTLALDRLERECRNQAATVRSLLTNRRDHPSFGTTLAMVRSALDQLTGMLEAWLYVTGTWGHNGAVLWDQATYDAVNLALDLNLVRLENELAQLRSRT